MAFVYLIKNGDLFKIGRTENLQRRLKQLSPGKLVYAGKTDRSRDLEYELHKRFKSVRIPQTEYFRLNDYQVELVKVALGWVRPQSTKSQSNYNNTHVHNNLRQSYIEEQAKKASEIMNLHRSHKLQEFKNEISAQNDWYKEQRIAREKLRKEINEQKMKELAQRKHKKWKNKLIRRAEAARNAKATALAHESAPKVTEQSINDKETRIRLAAERAEAVMREYRKSRFEKKLNRIWNYFYSIIRSIAEKFLP